MENFSKFDLAAWTSEFGARVLLMRRDRRLGQAELMERMGLTAGVMQLSKLERGQTRRLDMDLMGGLFAWAREAGYSLIWLITGEGRMRGGDRHASLEGVSDRDLIIEIGRRRIGDRIDEVIGELSAALAAGTNGEPKYTIESKKAATRPGFRVIGPESLPADWDQTHVPIVNRVAAGVGFDTAESEAGPPGWANEYVEIDQPPANAIAVRVVGESMEPTFASGDLLVVDPAQPAVAGQPAVVVFRENGGRWDTRAVCKVWRPGRRWAKLVSANEDFDDIRIPLDHVIRAFAIERHLPAFI